MKWYKPLFIGESVKNPNRTLRKINRGSHFTKAYLVCLPSNSNNLFDIISAIEVSQKGYPKKDLTIIGVCGTKDEAIELVAGLVQDMLLKQNNTDIITYLKKQRRT